MHIRFELDRAMTLSTLKFHVSNTLYVTGLYRWDFHDATLLSPINNQKCLNKFVSN